MQPTSQVSASLGHHVPKSLQDAQSHTTLHQVKVVCDSEDCFPTSFEHYIIFHLKKKEVPLDKKKHVVGGTATNPSYIHVNRR